MIRTIRLNRIHALNWYGYKDTIPCDGNVLLAGVTGSGKSILMDLIQFVLVGDQRLIRFNQSATGERSERTLKGYCLGDTKEDDNGVTQYMRQNAITYAALEFTWPSGKKVETWGMRIEFGSAADIQGRVTPFFIPTSLQRGSFLDTDKKPLDLASFRVVIEGGGGRLYFEGLDAYLRDMAQPVHLNFERNLLRSLLPTAMSFTFLRSFNEFCQKYILPADRLDVTDVTASYRTFLTYERELKQLNDQLEKLKEICGLFSNLIDLRRDVAIAQYLQAALSYEHASELLRDVEAELCKIKELSDTETKRLNELDKALPDIRTEMDRIKAAINANPEGQLYNELNSRKEKLVRSITELTAIGSTVEQALSNRLRKARQWLALLHALPLELKEQTTAAVDRALQAAEQGGIKSATETLLVLGDKARSAAAEASRAATPQLSRLAEIRQRSASLVTEIAALQIGKLPFPARLLDALNNRLPSNGSGLAASHLRDLCEVTDEHWRPAIEVAFTRKFAVVVAPEHYDKAEEIYHSLKLADLGADAGRESLINPTKALRLKKPVRTGSLAEKIKCNHPVAAAIISHFFGDVMRVEHRDQLRNHDFAILPDGFMARGAFVERRRFYDGLPFIGKRGLEQQLAWKQKELDELAVELRQLQPIEQALNGLASGAQDLFEVAPDIHRDLARAQELPRSQSELQETLSRIEAIDTASFGSLVKQRQKMEETIARFEREQRQLLGSPNRAKLRNLACLIIDRRKEVEALREEFDHIRSRTDISHWSRQLEEFRNDLLIRFPLKDIAAKHCADIASSTDREADVIFERLKAKRRELAIIYTKFEELPTDTEDNEAHAKQLDRLQSSDIPQYKVKAHRERENWENLFRTQVLEKLHTALQSIRDLLFFLNNSLKQHPVGNSRYQVRHTQNPDFKIYHDLIEANALARPGELFFASAEPRFRDAIERFLELLIEKSETIEAARLLDYRQYYEYDMEVIEEDGRKTSVDRHSGKFSGGENQSPYFIAILASYLRAYRRYGTRRQEPALGLVPIDEAFSKLSGERIKDCIEAIKAFDLQGVFSMSTGNIPYAFEHCDSLVVVSKSERRIGKRTEIRNIPVSLMCQSEEAQRIMGSSRGSNAKVATA